LRLELNERLGPVYEVGLATWGKDRQRMELGSSAVNSCESREEVMHARRFCDGPHGSDLVSDFRVCRALASDSPLHSLKRFGLTGGNLEIELNTSVAT
jgi:hypothetical protein